MLSIGEQIPNKKKKKKTRHKSRSLIVELRKSDRFHMRKNHSKQILGQNSGAIDQLTTLPSPTTLRKVEFLFEDGSSTSSSASKAAACTIDSDSWINSSIASMVGHENANQRLSRRSPSKFVQMRSIRILQNLIMQEKISDFPQKEIEKTRSERRNPVRGSR